MAISRLYEEFSICFAEDNSFWLQMSKEEQKHAKWIRELLEYALKVELKEGTTPLKSKAVETSIKYIDSMCQKCKMGNISRLSAYAIAFNIENFLLEKVIL